MHYRILLASSATAIALVMGGQHAPAQADDCLLDTNNNTIAIPTPIIATASIRPARMNILTCNEGASSG